MGCYIPICVTEYQGALRVGLAQKLACEMIIDREWEPIHNILEKVQAAKEEWRCL